MAENANALRPLVRWAGSKRQVLPEICSNIPEFSGKYIELFSGSACLFFHCNFSASLIADANKDLINFYQIVSERTEEVYGLFQEIPRNKDAYYEVRNKFNTEKNSLVRSVYFYYLNRNCFNGIFRTNLSGEFNVPFASSRVAKYLDWDSFKASAERLKSAHLISDDFENVCLRHTQADDFVYLDPPYYVPDVRVFKEYSAKHFGPEDFERLTNLLKEIDKREALFLLSYPDCEISRDLAKSWNFRSISTNRTIAASVASRKKAPELLISNY